MWTRTLHWESMHGNLLAFRESTIRLLRRFGRALHEQFGNLLNILKKEMLGLPKHSLGRPENNARTSHLSYHKPPSYKPSEPEEALYLNQPKISAFIPIPLSQAPCPAEGGGRFKASKMKAPVGLFQVDMR